MATYLYKAATADGKVINGTLTGSSREHVVEQLQTAGQIPIRIDEAVADRQARPRWQFRKPRIQDEHISDATRQLSILLRAGMPLDRALGVMVSLAEGNPLGPILDDVRTRVKQGATLADAMEAQETVFSRFYVNLLRAGEAGGALEIILEQLAEHLERSKEMRDTLISALIYPAILVVVAMVSIFILLAYVVPQFSVMFEGVEQVLPLSTRITISVGEAMQSYGWMGVLLLAAAIWLGHRRLQHPASLYKWHAWLLQLPLAGPIITRVEAARFARTLAILIGNGVPLLQSITIVKDTLTNRVMAHSLEQVADSIKQGQNLADPLERSGRFPQLAVQMVRVGEESGDLQQILLQVAATYDHETEVTIKRTLALLEPVLILVLGVVIAAVIISILVAILSINELVI